MSIIGIAVGVLVVIGIVLAVIDWFQRQNKLHAHYQNVIGRLEAENEQFARARKCVR